MMTDNTSETSLNHPAENNINQILDPQQEQSLVTNPYIHRPSYKDILLSKVTDDSNRMGINTFQLIHLLNSSQKISRDTANYRTTDEEDDSMRSDTTDGHSNPVDLKYYRMRLQFTVEETTPENYVEDVVLHLNRIMEIINLNTPSVSLAPWYKTKDFKKDELRTELTDDSLEAVRYLYGFKAGMTRNKTQYLRIHIAFPSYYQAEDIVKKNKISLMIPGKQTLLLANSQCVNPVNIGWFLRSTPMMADFDDLARVLKACWSVKGDFGLFWATVKDGKPYDAAQATRAIHIEVEEEEASSIKKCAEKTYGRPSSNMLDYPLGINMMFVLPYNDVQGATKSMVAKLASYQQTNDKMVMSSTWYGEMAIDRSIHPDTFISLWQWLMSLKSINHKTTTKGLSFQDNLFTGIHRSPDGREVTFYYYKANEGEASNLIAGLPLVVRDELKLDPGCFFHRSDYLPVIEGTWNAETTREYKNSGVLNQEEYLQELDDFFSVNRSFLPEMIVLDKVETVDSQAKALALASGADDVSILSQLTEKTLRAATMAATGSNGQDESSIESGNTSRSKTQAAVKEALKEVSIEHNKAMEEQRLKFQRELEALRKSMDKHHNQETSASLPSDPQENNPEHPISATPTETEAENHSAQATTMEIDSSDDEEALARTRVTSRRMTMPAKDTKSPITKRPKRSKSRTPRARGGTLFPLSW
jgi:hypothetical protein